MIVTLIFLACEEKNFKNQLGTKVKELDEKMKSIGHRACEEYYFYIYKWLYG